MASPVAMLQNVLLNSNGPLTALQVKRLETAATLDGQVDAQERQFFSELTRAGRLDGNQTAEIDAWLQAPKNPEIARVRASAAGFDAQLKALKAKAKPGDLLFWGGESSGKLVDSLGPWRHVSLVLENGKVLDTMTIEGASISGMDAVLAKSLKRIQATKIVIARPKESLNARQIKELTKAAEQLQGRDYALFSRMSDPTARVSCSRSVYDALKSVGVDLAPERSRNIRGAVMPADLIPGVRAVGAIDKAGAFTAGRVAEFHAWRPTGIAQVMLKAWDFVSRCVPLVWRVMDACQERFRNHIRLP